MTHGALVIDESLYKPLAQEIFVFLQHKKPEATIRDLAIMFAALICVSESIRSTMQHMGDDIQLLEDQKGDVH